MKAIEKQSANTRSRSSGEGIAAINLVQQAKKTINENDELAAKNTALIDGVRKFALSVTDLEIDLIDRINPFGEAYAILAKSMSEERLKLVAEAIPSPELRERGQTSQSHRRRSARVSTTGPAVQTRKG